MSQYEQKTQQSPGFGLSSNLQAGHSVGARADLERGHKGPATTVVDLAGRTLVPGFVDPHSHYFSSLSVANQVNVDAPPAGLLMETAYMPIFASLPPPNAEQEVDWTRAGQKLYAAAGITTAHEGATVKSSLAAMQRAAAAGAHLIDVVAFRGHLG